MEIKINQIVFFTHSEEYWNKPYRMKRHHVYSIKTVTLRGLVTDIKGNEFKAILKDNNGFIRDGEEYVFNKNSLLCNQDFKNLDILGQWKYED